MFLNAILVEDSSTIRENLVAALAELVGMEVIAFAETEAHAIKELADHGTRWHVAILDLFLKEGSGLGVLTACQGRAAHQRMVVLTNYATHPIRERCLALGADVVFDKSTDLEGFFAYCSAYKESLA